MPTARQRPEKLQKTRWEIIRGGIGVQGGRDKRRKVGWEDCDDILSLGPRATA